MNWLYKLRYDIYTYYESTGISVQLLSKEGDSLGSFGEKCSCCHLFQEGSGKCCPCQKAHLQICREADRLKDGYISSCPVGYIHFAVPVYFGKILRATVLAGPVALDSPDMTLIDDIIQKYDLNIRYRAKLYGAYASAPLIEPRRVNYLCKLLTALAINISSTEENTIRRRQIEQDIQQAKIGEYIRIIKEDEPVALFQYEQERQLIADVLAGKAEQARELLNELLGRIYFASGNNFEIIRTRTIELTALLSRAIVENGGGQAEVYQMTDHAIKGIVGAENLTELSYTLMEILDIFIEMAFPKYKVPDSVNLQKAVSYINEHYFERLSLESVANFVGLNPSYFSLTFKRQMQISFSEYLTEQRVRQAKVLLKNSNMPLSEVALAVGFENQSYFSRVFKKGAGMSPRQFRERSD